MNRNIFQTLSKVRLKEGKLLFRNGFFSGFYYLLGYSIEFALKSCISKNVKKFDFPDKQRVIDSYTHNFDKLIKVSNLEDKLIDQKNKNQEFRANWDIVNQWIESSRYSSSVSKDETSNLINAIENKTYGVLKWIKQYW